MARGDALLLEVADYRDPQHWRWVLKDASGNYLADQEVSLDFRDPNYIALLDLQRYLDRNSSPDNRIPDQKRLLDELSGWIGSKLFGKVADTLAKYRTPVTIRVIVPPEAEGIAHLPLELAEVGDRPIALRDLSLVFEMADSEPMEHEEVGERLRMLAVFSLPTDVSALALRRERYQLMRLINSIAQTHDLAVVLRVLQYGVTRENLRDALEEGEGWDLVHISGHGKEGAVVLENPDGTMDEVSSEDLADLLSLARGRLKFVTLSSCLSAAATLEETLNWLKIPVPEKVKEDASCDEPDGGPMSALAQKLVESLDCAALAMRYPVGDEFAIKLASELYERLLGKGQTLPRALQLSLKEALKRGYDAASPPLSFATPALFGREASDFLIKPPSVAVSEFRMPAPGLSFFPDEPERFVGRSGPMIRSSSALAVESDKRGVLFHGMAGAGKTACALELSYHHSRSSRFQGFVWYKAPDQGKDIGGALVELAMEMERQLPGFKMVHAIGDAESFRDFLPVLKRFLESESILIVLDNLESLLTSEGKRRDERWSLLIQTLLEHGGFSRTILTSRQLPQDLDSNRLVVEPIFALTLNESILLAREMPNLGRLLSGKSSVSLSEGRNLVSRTLALVQGHPKLIELAESQAEDPAALELHLEKVAQTWGDKSRLSSFFEKGESSGDAEKFLEVLKGWTQSLSAALPQEARTFFHLLCSLEESDRLSKIVDLVWPNLWKRLELPGQATDIDELLGEMKALVEVQRLGDIFRFSIHPGVAEAGLAELGEGFRTAADLEMANFWSAFFQAASKGEMEGAGGWIVQAGLRSAPYLMRLERWDEASILLEEAIHRDKSTDTIAAVLPMLRQIAVATVGTEREMIDTAKLVKLLIAESRWQEAETMVRPLVSKFAEENKFRFASTAAVDLFGILISTGRFEDALYLVEEMKEYDRKAGLGPWTQLLADSCRLKALSALGNYKETLEALKELRLKMKAIPDKGEQEESTWPWHVREQILESGLEAALYSEEYDLALELNAEIFESKRDRGATELSLTITSFNDYGPLLGLERYEEAGKLLWCCKEVFEKKKDIKGLGKTFTALGDLKGTLGQVDQAVRFEKDALRYKYLTGDARDIFISHHNLGNSLAKSHSKKALAHHLSTAMICSLTGSGFRDLSFQDLMFDLNEFGLEALPTNFDQLCETVEEVKGVKFRELFVLLAGPDADGDAVMQAVLQMAQEMEKGEEV